MKIRFRQIKKWIDIEYAKYYRLGLKRYLKAAKILKYKQILNRLYGMQITTKIH